MGVYTLFIYVEVIFLYLQLGYYFIHKNWVFYQYQAFKYLFISHKLEENYVKSLKFSNKIRNWFDTNRSIYLHRNFNTSDLNFANKNKDITRKEGEEKEERK